TLRLIYYHSDCQTTTSKSSNLPFVFICLQSWFRDASRAARKFFSMRRAKGGKSHVGLLAAECRPHARSTLSGMCPVYAHLQHCRVVLRFLWLRAKGQRLNALLNASGPAASGQQPAKLPSIYLLLSNRTFDILLQVTNRRNSPWATLPNAAGKTCGKARWP